MSDFRTLLTTLLIACAYVTTLSADEPNASFDPADGQTIVFAGDSITHQALYTQYIEDFFFTRFPDRELRFHNAGVAGDSAADLLTRFDEDVAVHKPNYVTILLGMNDGRYEDFNAETFHTYQSLMAKVLDRVEASGAKAIVLSPTMFDHAVTNWRRDDQAWRFRAKEFSPDYNALMAFFGGWALEESRRRGNPFVNLWAPLNTFTEQGRRSDPRFTLIGDAIHPQASGQVVMASEILMQLDVDRKAVSSIVIARRGDRWVGSKGIENLEANDGGTELSFSHQANSLPWVIPEQHATKQLRWLLPSDGRKGYEITKAGHKLSADRIKISGLPAGTYEVLIDGKSVGTWNHVALGTRVEMQANPLTPQYQQSVHVAELNRYRNDEFVRPMRDKWGTIKGLRRRYADDPPRLEKLTAEAKRAIDDLRAKSDVVVDELRLAAQPPLRRWQIRKAAK